MNILIIQARCGSSRLHNKVMLKINEKEILKIVYDRCKLSKKVDKIIVATSTNIEDNKIYDLCNKYSIDCYRGDERDLINRYYYLSKLLNTKTIIRVTSDCPYIDHKIMDNMLDIFIEKKLDYIYNTDENDNKIYPEGSDIEIFNFSTLEYLMFNEFETREHASGVLRFNKKYLNIFKIYEYDCKFNNLLYKNNLIGI